MLVYCFLSGIALGALWGLLKALFIKTTEEQSNAAKRLEARLRPPQRLWRARVAGSEKVTRAIRMGSGVVSAVADCLIFLFSAIILILILYETNDGQFRLSAPMLMLVGCLVYRLTLGRLVARCLDLIVVLIRCAIIWMLVPVTLPFRLLFRLIGRWMVALRRRLTDRWKENQRRRIEKRLLREQKRAEKQENRDDRDPIIARPPNSPRYFSKGTKHC